MAKFTVTSNNKNKSDNVIPIKIFQVKREREKQKFLIKIIIVQSIIILGCLWMMIK